jgi:hypothetical protein
MQAVGGARFHPRGEAFVQPQVVPPRHGDQIAEPLVRDFVRGHQEGGFLVGLGGGARVEQHRVFKGEDGAPVFHRAEGLAAARRGDVVQFGQRVLDAEVVVVLLQHGARAVERKLGLPMAFLRDHAQFHAIFHGAGALEFAQAEEQQIGRHLRRGGEAHQLTAVGQFGGGGDRHIRHGHLAGRDGGFQREGGFVERLVPRRDHAARVGFSNWVYSARFLAPPFS